jgi:malate synthase
MMLHRTNRGGTPETYCEGPAMAPDLPQGINVTGPLLSGFDQILTKEALDFVAMLHRTFEQRRQELLRLRVQRQKKFDAGELPDFLPETKPIRDGDWQIAPIPDALQRRRIEITGPVDRKMVINALNSGADVFMADFEDANTPTWKNQIQGQINVRDAVRRTITFETAEKNYRLNECVAMMHMRPRGWHLDEKHVTCDGQRVSGALFDFALYFFHNARDLIAQGAGPYFYLPKLESHLEASLWNAVFNAAQESLGLPRGTIKATVLVETILAAFEMEEILFELREHSAGLNAGRWDYIFSAIKKFRANKDFCLANRGSITMTSPFMRAYSLLLLKTCHKRGAQAIGGMSALIPIKSDPEKHEAALQAIRSDKQRDAGDGYDGGWVAHPGLVSCAMEEFAAVLGPRANQIEKQRNDVTVTAADLLNFQPEQPITEIGLRHNISVGIQYLGSWLAGTGCVPIFNLMEDAATAEIARAQVWQWIRSPKGELDDGRKVTNELVRELIPQELAKVKELVGATAYTATYQRAAEIFEEMSTAENFVEFLTLPLYEALE